MSHPVLEQFRGKRVTIVGFAREGAALVPVLAGAGARITVSDSRPARDLQRFIDQVQGYEVDFSLGENRVEDVERADFVFLSPGVPKWIPIVEAAYELQKPIWSETRLVFAMCQAPIIGITGSSGKTTTTSLIGHLMAASGRPTVVGGNIGKPLVGEIESVTADSVVVLELSSFQLQVMTESPHVAVVTVVTPDHLDVHRSMEEYIEAKRNIVRFQKAGDIAVLNYANEVTRGYAEAIDSTVLWFNAGPDRPGVRVEERRIIAGMPGEEAVEIGPLSLVPLRGQHNIANACAAIAAVMAMGVEAEVIRQALPTFSGVEHRLEFVRQVKGVRYYNDSIATTPERATAGVLSFDEPLVVIAGGRGKNLDMSAFGALLADRAHTVLLVGESGAELRRAIEATGREVTVIDCGSLEVAVSTAAEVARPGDIVLLAPAYTSFDQFPDYAARGRAFKDLVLALGGAQ